MFWVPGSGSKFNLELSARNSPCFFCQRFTTHDKERLQSHGFPRVTCELSITIHRFSAFCRFWLPFLVAASGCRFASLNPFVVRYYRLIGDAQWNLENSAFFCSLFTIHDSPSTIHESWLSSLEGRRLVLHHSSFIIHHSSFSLAPPRSCYHLLSQGI